MRAAVLHEHGATPELGDFDDPGEASGCVVVHVAACALHHFDLHKASGTYYTGPPPLPSVVGSDGVGRLEDGRRVYFDRTCAPHGAMAERTLVPADAVLEAFLRDASDGGVDEIHVVYNRFVSMMTQTPSVVRLLPLAVVEGVEEPDGTVQPLYEFEPDVETVLDALLPVYVESRIFNALLQSAAAKHAATQKAMKSASDNADKLITDYTRLANNARQAEITQQISEIVGGADALVAK